MAMEERSFRTQNLILENRKRLSVSGVEEVEGFDEQSVQIRTALGVLVVRGERLHVENLSVESGDLLVTGEISEMDYEDIPVRGKVWGKLFG